MQHRTLPLNRILINLFLAVVLLGILLVAMDWGETRRVLFEADWERLPAALLFTTISYVCMAFSFSLVSQMLDIPMKRGDLARIGFISATINHVLTSGGVAGYSIRYYFMHKYGVPLRDVLAASFLHFYLTSLDMLSILPFGVAYLLFHAVVPRGVAVILGVLTLVLAVIAILAALLIFRNNLRARILDLLSRAAQLVLHRNILSTMRSFDTTMKRGVDVMRERPILLLQIMVLTFIDWICSLLVLGFCFDALGPSLRVGVLVTGFVIGMVAGVVSMVPGGFGVQEGSMAGIFALLGVSFEQAVLAAILFRVLFFILPYLFSLGFYWRLLREPARHVYTATEKEV